MAKKCWSPERNQKLIRMYESGECSTSEMAELLKVSIPTVYNHLRRMGLRTTTLPRRHRAAVKFVFSDQEKQRIVDLAHAGEKVSQIALTIQRTLGPTRRIFRELGLSTRVAKPLRPDQRFGALTVTKEATSQKTYKGHFESRSYVLCDCGKTLIVFNHNLRVGHTTSCGCKIHRRNRDREWIRVKCAIESGARVRGLAFTLTTEQIKHISLMACGYCGALAVNKSKGRKGGRTTGQTVLEYNGIDRVDSAIGYIPGNVIPCCIVCNRAKSSMKLVDFMYWLQRIGSTKAAAEIDLLSDEVGRQIMQWK